MTDGSTVTQRYVHTSSVIATDLAGNTVLLDTQSWAYFEFDAIASSIWTLLEIPRTLPALVEALRGEFNVDEDRCRSDTQQFLDEMIAQGLVTVLSE